jgi:predicted transcriptional regulator
MTAETTAATRAHGTRARYVHGPGPGSGPGCRCDDCRTANRAAERTRGRQILYGRWQPYVDAEPSRRKVRELAGAGIGWKRAAELSGLSAAAVSNLLYGRAGRAPSKRVRAETEAAILAIPVSAELAAAGTVIDGTGTRRRLQALVAAGHAQAHLAAGLDMLPSNFPALIGAERVTAGTARAVRSLYSRLWDQSPPGSTRPERAAVTRARRYAEARSWPVPMAWDDDQIDLPEGRPAEGWQRTARTTHRSADLAEDAEELFRTEGSTREQAADRLGVSPAALEAALRRAEHTRAQEHDAQRAIFAQAGGERETRSVDREAG